MGFSQRGVVPPFRGWGERRAREAARRAADRDLLASRLSSPRLAWRAAELTEAQHRVDLGRAVTDVARGGGRPLVSRRSRCAASECRVGLLTLAVRLHDLEHAVEPQGILLAERLLRDRRGPLYRDDVEALDGAIEEALAALEP